MTPLSASQLALPPRKPLSPTSSRPGPWWQPWSKATSATSDVSLPESASLPGTGPPPSGCPPGQRRTTGDRAGHNAIHAEHSSAALHPAVFERKLRRGNTGKEALRSLKRRITHLPWPPPGRRPLGPSGPHSGLGRAHVEHLCIQRTRLTPGYTDSFGTKPIPDRRQAPTETSIQHPPSSRQPGGRSS